MDKKNKNIFKGLLWLLEGIIVGFGAIMPGISGGTLCVAFGMYLPLIGVISHPKDNIRKYGKMLAVFVLGAAVGFIGLSGFAGWLLEMSSELVTCAFIGFILGTFPELWKDAGRQGRMKSSYISLGAGFAAILALLLFMKNHSMIAVEADLSGFLLCGMLWGLSLIVPGLSSSTLLLFFGLYQPMLDGIARMDMEVIIPLAIGILLCVMLLSKGVNLAYKKYCAQISHFIIGVVAATTVMIFPDWTIGGINLLYQLLCIVGGCLASYSFTRICAKLKK